MSLALLDGAQDFHTIEAHLLKQVILEFERPELEILQGHILRGLATAFGQFITSV